MFLTPGIQSAFLLPICPIAAQVGRNSLVVMAPSAYDTHSNPFPTHSLLFWMRIGGGSWKFAPSVANNHIGVIVSGMYCRPAARPSDRPFLVPEEVNALFRDKNRMEMKEPNANWAMTSPYLCDMLSQFQYPLYYADGVKYGVPWFANNVQKVYFPINEKDSHWVLRELHISSGLITIYDSPGCPPNGIESRLFWLDLREKLQLQIPLFLDNAKVFEKKNIVKDDYSIIFNLRMASQSKVVFMVIVDYGFAYFYTGCHIIYLWRLMIPSVLHWHIMND
ncbi:ulp1 protease family, C-terminal catalytic domain-containing protein [Tanacetum coccineum]